MAKDIEYNGKFYPCTVSLAMDLIGGKWKSVILYHLIEGEKRYNELRKEIPIITEMMLSIQLKQLEENNLINRKVTGTKPPLKVIYNLTEFGKTFIPALEKINEWGHTVVTSIEKINPSR
ncbi:winged helix-turn-helix transcriptional regulator [Flavobacterium sp. HJJ]|uniref:winged helix-turn-helix transcriptional regulator n=1 Tax=Flavobacterium sp. HJJ TaxID=2783792 RepID=UPI00188CBD24|nr:helix-turn-helix domain-containing protein [Flavobacterium sp. HJJ]MBF4471553.1 helix-turn-helix transcriptional regulator [Flavobacterium sp. HJJ]